LSHALSSATRSSLALNVYPAFAKVFIGMKPSNFRIALVTAPDVKTARRLARAALEARLIACANLIPGVESHYQWQGKIERGSEVLMILKTTTKCLARLEKLIIAAHPYDTPEFIVIDLRGGNRRYLDWLQTGCEPT
jgi:periplasmic divalent cation tolerance protein